jgi:hypothetical protein
MKRKNIFDVPLDSDEGQMISAISQLMAERFREESPELFDEMEIPEMMLLIKKYWNMGIIEVAFDEENDGFHVLVNPLQAIKYMESEMA